MNKIWAVAGLAIAAAMLVGCEDPTRNEWEFKNLSSHTVSVTPDEGQDWSSFNLATDQSKKVKISEKTIYYKYTPSNKVYPDNSTKGKVFFYNR